MGEESVQDRKVEEVIVWPGVRKGAGPAGRREQSTEVLHVGALCARVPVQVSNLIPCKQREGLS